MFVAIGESRTFVSYSHDDAALVGPVVRLLRVQNPAVFHDVDSIRPGKKWREEIEAAIQRSSLLILFWCHHAQESDEVEAEWRAALALEKDLLPILLDDTPLADELAQYQWIDFQGLVAESHRGEEPIPAPMRASALAPKRSRVPYWLATAAAVVLGVGISLTVLTGPPDAAPIGDGPGEAAASFSFIWIAVLAVVLGIVVWALARRRAAQAPEEPRSPEEPVIDKPAPQTETYMDVTSQMAERIESEVLRRMG